jgi:uncharacterized protein (TIGR03083 family)
VDAQLHALQVSVSRLRDVVAPLDDATLDRPGYPSEWSIADVLSHIGSGAEIMRRRLDDALLGHDTPDVFSQSVWDVWNAKSPRAKADDALVTDRALVDRLASLTKDERSRFRTSLGPMELDATTFVGLRLNEHALHTWDVEVALDPRATVPPDAAALVVDSLEMIARFTARPTGSERSVVVHTTDPIRAFTIALRPGAVAFAPGGAENGPDLCMAAEAFCRLVYGRLDPAHTPAVEGDPTVLDELRLVFPGL